MFQTFSDPRAADPFPVPLEGMGVFHGITVFLAHTLQEAEIPGPVIAEAKIIPHHQMANTHALNQDVLAEFPGGLAAETAVKLHTQHPIYTQLGQDLHLLPERHQAGGSFVRGKEFPGLRFEHHNGRGNL